MNNLIRQVNINNQYIKYQIPLVPLYLIKWFPDAKTKIHSHEDKECYFMTLWGGIREFRYFDCGKSVIVKDIEPFSKNHINDSIGKHKMINCLKETNWSIHYYY